MFNLTTKCIFALRGPVNPPGPIFLAQNFGIKESLGPVNPPGPIFVSRH
jgi:hypothetical protein